MPNEQKSGPLESGAGEMLGIPWPLRFLGAGSRTCGYISNHGECHPNGGPTPASGRRLPARRPLQLPLAVRPAWQPLRRPDPQPPRPARSRRLRHHLHAPPPARARPLRSHLPAAPHRPGQATAVLPPPAGRHPRRPWHQPRPAAAARVRRPAGRPDDSRPARQRKQDCETNAAKRWLTRWHGLISHVEPVCLGDAPHATQAFRSQVLAAGEDFLFIVQRGSHRTRFSFVDSRHDFSTGWPRVRHPKTRRIDRRRYRWQHWVPEPTRCAASGSS